MFPQPKKGGAWVNGVWMDPQNPEPADGSVEFVIDNGSGSASACDLATCKVLRSLAEDNRALQQELNELRDKSKKPKRSTRERVLEHRIEDDRKRMRRLAEKNQQLSEENKRLVRAVLSRSIGFGIGTPIEEMDHVIDALTWWCIASGDDVDRRVDYWEMWDFHDSISDEVRGIVKEYDEAMKRGRS